MISEKCGTLHLDSRIVSHGAVHSCNRCQNESGGDANSTERKWSRHSSHVQLLMIKTFEVLAGNVQ